MYEEIFDIIFKNFMEYLSNQKQLTVAEDLLPDMLYVFMKSPDHINIGRSIIFKGVSLLMPENTDAQLNLEYRVDRSTYVQIRYHKKSDLSLANANSWVISGN